MSSELIARRQALKSGAITAVAGLLSAKGAHANTPQDDNRDADLIAVCDRLVANHRDQMKLYARRRTMTFAEEKSTDPELHALIDQADALLAELDEIGVEPQTTAGGVALARAALSQAPLRRDGTVDAPYDAEWLAWSVVEFVAGLGDGA